MGNQISVSPSQLLPPENYLVDLNSQSSKEKFEYQRSLGSTRFLKVVMCRSDQGPIVIKIFVIQDSTLPLIEHKKKIKDISNKLHSAVNCLPYERVELTDRAAFIMRQYIKTSLYDRISTRPFLVSIEKKWLAFQLLCAVNQCHQEKIYHGDIKSENILVTSWSWLILIDFASYKPVLLPEDNPADYTYFFDTARRSVCHVAPERFIKTLHNGELVLEPSQEAEAYLTPAMDMFSTGCVLAELFTEGFYPFNFMQLHQYRTNQYYPTNVLDKITDDRARSMIEVMINKNPSERRSAAAFLKEEKGNLFPNYFYTFLFPFFKQFALSPGLTADERIKKVSESLQDILDALEVKKTNEYTERVETNKTGEEIVSKTQNEALIIFTSLITSCVRSLQYPSSKLNALELFRILSEYVPNEVILDRILPYIFSLLEDNEPRVRAESLYTLTHCLKMVNAVPRSEANIFPEYILPHLNDVSNDQSIIVRQALAANISYTADASLRFLKYCLRHCPDYSTDTQIDSIQEIIKRKLAKIFSDSSNIVKRALIESNLKLLCKFFGKEKANDILVSHLITYLNEKRDFHLRLSFYENITDIATFMGPHFHQILKPLFLQGLRDTEETVITHAIDNMSRLTEYGMFPDHILLEIAKDASPLLVHPNHWIRLATVGLIAAVSNRVEYLDVITTIAMIVRPFLTVDGFQLKDEGYILSKLKDPLPRSLYDCLIRCSCIEVVLNALSDSQKNRISVHTLPDILGEDKAAARNVIKRLLIAGLTDPMVFLILLMNEHLIKVNQHRKGLEIPLPDQQQGYIILDKREQQPILHKFKLITKENSVDIASNFSSPSNSLQKSSSLTMNEEWQTMFGNGGPSEENRINSGALTSSKQPSLGASLSSQCFVVDQPNKDSSKKYIALCQQELEQLLHRKREELLVSIQTKSAVNAETAALASRVAENPSLTSGSWRPMGHLVAHLHEHTGAITKLIPLKGTTLYASSSKDGTFKVWDCNKTERTYPINRSKFTYSQQHGSTITSVAHCSMHESIASASDNSSIHVVKIDKQSLLSSRHLDKHEDGYATHLNYMDAGSQSVLTYSTVYGKIYGWDLRSQGNAWVLDNSVKNGLLTSYAIDSSNNWLACGTSSGYIMCWDLRFMLRVSQVRQHNANHAIQCLKMHPIEPSLVISCTRGFNEVAFFNMETKSRSKTLWASPEPPLSNKKSLHKEERPKIENWFYGLYPGVTEAGNVYVLTVGTDSQIRYWDLKTPSQSYIVSHRASSNLKYNVSYEQQYVNDSDEVIVEKLSTTTNPDDSVNKADQPHSGHLETITDVIVVNQPQKMIISSGYDGTIKMWK